MSIIIQPLKGFVSLTVPEQLELELYMVFTYDEQDFYSSISVSQNFGFQWNDLIRFNETQKRIVDVELFHYGSKDHKNRLIGSSKIDLDEVDWTQQNYLHQTNLFDQNQQKLGFLVFCLKKDILQKQYQSNPQLSNAHNSNEPFDPSTNLDYKSTGIQTVVNKQTLPCTPIKNNYNIQILQPQGHVSPLNFQNNIQQIHFKKIKQKNARRSISILPQENAPQIKHQYSQINILANHQQIKNLPSKNDYHYSPISKLNQINYQQINNQTKMNIQNNNLQSNQTISSSNIVSSNKFATQQMQQVKYIQHPQYVKQLQQVQTFQQVFQHQQIQPFQKHINKPPQIQILQQPVNQCQILQQRALSPFQTTRQQRIIPIQNTPVKTKFN